MDQTHLQLSREPRALPKLVIKRKPESIFDYRFEDFEIELRSHPPVLKRRWLSNQLHADTTDARERRFFCLKSRYSANIPEIVQRSAT